MPGKALHRSWKRHRELQLFPAKSLIFRAPRRQPPPQRTPALPVPLPALTAPSLAPSLFFHLRRGLQRNQLSIPTPSVGISSGFKALKAICRPEFNRPALPCPLCLRLPCPQAAQHLAGQDPRTSSLLLSPSSSRLPAVHLSDHSLSRPSYSLYPALLRTTQAPAMPWPRDTYLTRHSAGCASGVP